MGWEPHAGRETLLTPSHTGLGNCLKRRHRKSWRFPKQAAQCGRTAHLKGKLREREGNTKELEAPQLEREKLGNWILSDATHLGSLYIHLLGG